MIAPLALALTGLLPFTLLIPGTQPPPPTPAAAFFPAHTYLYLQVNPHSSLAGFKGLNLARLLQDPAVKKLLGQAVAAIPEDADPRKFLERYPFDRALGDSIGLGLVGLNATTPAQGETPRKTWLLPEDGRLSQQLFRGRTNVQGRLLVAIQLQDEELFQKTLLRFLTDAVFDGEPAKPDTQIVDGTEMQAWEIPGPGRVYSKIHDGYCLLAQFPGDIAAAVARHEQRAVALSTRSDFARFAAHRGDQPTAAFLHVGVDSAIDLASPLIPRRDREEIAKWGGFDYSGLQLGMGFCDGGICEWLQLAFAENPRGILMNLARLWPATGYIEHDTHRGRVYAASLTFDWAALVNATTFILDLCEVDTKSLLADVNSELGGFDLREDLMGALGNTMGAVGIMPKIGLIPELSLVFKVRNRAKMWQVIQRVKALCKDNGIPTRDFTVSGGGPKATYLNIGKDIPIKPAFALTGDKLVVSLMPLMLKYAVRKTRRTGKAIIDFVPDPTAGGRPPMFSSFYDPAPMTENIYADLLKLLDSSDRRLPIEVTDLPSPEFMASCTSKIGIEFSIDSYYMSVDLHSPTSFSIPLALGAAAAAQMDQGPPPRQQPKRVRTVH